MAEIAKPAKGNFLLLESLYRDKAFARVAHVILPDASKLQFKLGRGHESDVKIPDISVSRVHALITMSNKGFSIKDVNSKFGTLLLLPNEPKELELGSDLSLQVGRTVLRLVVRKNEHSPKHVVSLADAISIQFSEFPNKYLIKL